MKLTQLDPTMLSLTDIICNGDELYCIMHDEFGKLALMPMSEASLLGSKIEDFVVVQISETETNLPLLVEPEKVVEVPKKRRLTYRISEWDEHDNIFVEGRPNGNIRVSFKDKDSANVYFEYFREQFYKSTSGADVITVSNIYKDLHIVNFDEAECDDWGWYTLDSGTCRHISEVAKTKNLNRMYGFTLYKPTKLYLT